MGRAAIVLAAVLAVASTACQAHAAVAVGANDCPTVDAFGACDSGASGTTRRTVDCTTGQPIAYTAIGGFGIVGGDMIIGTEEELASSNCANLPHPPVEPAGTYASTQEAFSAGATLWPNGEIPYVFEPNVISGLKELIKEAIAHIESATPLRFVNQFGPFYVSFQMNADLALQGACGLSNVGMQTGGFINSTNVALVPTPDVGCIIHEILHAIGMIHTHQRPDRDQYVRLASCALSDPSNFGVEPIRQFGPYDYASIMHYPRDAFCAGSLTPLMSFRIPLPLCPQNSEVTTTGQRCSLSIGDVDAIWHFYPPPTVDHPSLTAAQLGAVSAVVSDYLSDADGGSTPTQGVLENPPPSTFQSGIGLVSGWVCNANHVTFQIDNGALRDAAYGTSRGDTVGICGDANNGFGALLNWSVLGDGTHTLQVFADGVQFGSATFNVATLGTTFLAGASGQYVVNNFPFAGESVTLRWQEGSQNFVIARAHLTASADQPDAVPQASVTGVLENPGGSSFQSGIGVISGWVCSAGKVTLSVDGAGSVPAAYGTSRSDTVTICGDANNGFGMLLNWNLLGDGTHTVTAFADGIQFGRATFTVTTLGTNFLRGVTRQHNFNFNGGKVFVRWQEGQQNFVIVGSE